MAWTSPRTWVAGETPPASTLNTHIRDNLKAIGDPWAAWTPTWTAVSVNPAIGNGTKTGGASIAGKMINFWIQIVTGSTTTYGTGAWQFDLPAGESSHRWTFTGTARDASAAQSFPVFCERTASGLLTVRTLPTVAGNQYASVTSAIPFTWASTDELFISGTYEGS